MDFTLGDLIWRLVFTFGVLFGSLGHIPRWATEFFMEAGGPPYGFRGMDILVAILDHMVGDQNAILETFGATWVQSSIE